jgi:hypothetical protein
MARISTTEANQALATTGWAYVSLHSADPGTTGASELTGGSPAYARVAVTWNTASGGSVTNSSSLTFNFPASTTAAYFGIWSASTAGTYYIGGALNGGTPIVNGTSQGTITIAASAITVTAS